MMMTPEQRAKVENSLVLALMRGDYETAHTLAMRIAAENLLTMRD